MDLTGKVAVITGASSGIGEATALALAQAGVKLVLAARREERLEALAQKIKGIEGEAVVFAADLRDADKAEACIEKAAQAFGRIDILVNNAGTMLLSPIDRAEPSDWQSMLEINLLSLMYTSRAALIKMRAQSSGHIVNLSSVAGRSAGPTAGGYNASKWGVNGFSEALRREAHRDGVRVTVIEPGVVATELTEHIPDEETRTNYEARVGEMEPLESEDVAAAILYAVTQPRRVNVNEILIRPLDQA